MILIHNGLDMDKTRLKEFTHAHWGSIVGQENEIRVAVLEEEVALWEKRLSDKPDDIPYLGYIRTTLRGRIKELEDQEKELDKQEKN